MATKTGILSDKMLEVNCKDYKALPIGFANSEFQGNMSNPFLPGIKTPKYQRSAPKPVSADVVAVSTARFLQGNRAENARLILDQYQREAKEYTPPPVNLAKINRDIMDKRERENRQAVNPLPRVFAGVTRGELATKQAMGTHAEPTLNIKRLMEKYSKYTKPTQLEIGRKLHNVFLNAGINFEDYEVGKRGRKGEKIMSEFATDIGRKEMVERGLVALALMRNNANVYDIFGMQKPQAIYADYGYNSPAESPVGEQGTAANEAPTVPGQQGVAQTETPTTQTEIEKK